MRNKIDLFFGFNVVIMNDKKFNYLILLHFRFRFDTFACTGEINFSSKKKYDNK